MTSYRMPAEWEPHAATWLAWPSNRDDWPGRWEPVPWIYAEMIRALREPVRLFVREPTVAALMDFHSRHKLLLMAHSPADARALGRLVAETTPLEERLAPLPLALLDRFADVVDSLRRAGLHTLGDVLALPGSADTDFRFDISLLETLRVFAPSR